MIPNSRHDSDERFVGPCYVKERQVLFNAYRDSGAPVSLAYDGFVDESAYMGEMITAYGIFEPDVKIPTAVILIKFSEVWF